MAKPWEEMSREELLDERARWEANLQKVNLDLAVTRARGASGNYADADTYQQMLAERVRLTAGLRGVSTQLSKVKAQAHNSVDAAFRKVAKLILEEDLYEEILQGAQGMLVDGGRR